MSKRTKSLFDEDNSSSSEFDETPQMLAALTDEVAKLREQIKVLTDVLKEAAGFWVSR